MIGAVFWFDLRQRLRRLGFAGYYLLFVASSCLLFMAAAGAFPSVNVGFSTGGKVMTNSPFNLHTLIMVYCVFSVQLTAAAMGQAIHQDYESQTTALFFTTSLTKRQYLVGRYLSALVYLVIMFSSFGVGFALGSVLPGTEPTLIGPNRFAAYAMPYLVGVLPDQIIAGSLFFALAARTRSMRGVYTASVVLLVVYLIAGSTEVKVEYKWVASMLDPFGSYASQYLTEYWSIAEKNTRLVLPVGWLLWNRGAWMALSIAATVALMRGFRLGHPEESGGGDRSAPTTKPPATPSALPKLTTRSAGGLSLLASFTAMLFRDTVRNVYFVIIALSAAGMFAVTSQSLGAIYGTPTYPVTYQIVSLAAGAFQLFTLIIVIYFSGELVWRERDNKMDQLVDALPTPDWVLPVARVLVMFGILIVMQAVTMACGILFQVWKGYYQFELKIYVVELFGFGLLRNGQLAILALFIQSLARNKATGHSLVIAYYIGKILMLRFGFEHPLYRFGSTPSGMYSDMNGWGHFLAPVLWYDAYWYAWTILLLVGAVLFGARGKEEDWRFRTRFAKQRFTMATGVVVLACAASAAGLGVFLFEKSNRVGRYLTDRDERAMQANYERRHKSTESAPQPKIESVDVEYDLDPSTRTLGLKARYVLRNRTTAPIDEVFVTLNPICKLGSLTIGGVAPQTSDTEVGFHRIKLAAPLAPNATTELVFEGRYTNWGYLENEPNTRVVENGTFIDSTSLPTLGYIEDAELSSDDARRKEKLPLKNRMHDLDDKQAQQRSYIRADADWVSVHSKITTKSDQIALAPGSLVSDTTNGDRRTFEYRTDAPVLGFFSMISARYAVEKAQWRDVAIEIYYHPTHRYNVQRMIEGVQDTLTYLTETVGPYPHKQVRIVEFPRYQTFAQSFPTTIPFSESIGFIAKVDPNDEKDVDYPYYVTSHEVAHQWWANQVVGADVQGATLLSESLSQYTALMVMKRKIGANQMKRFLRYELDQYLTGRSTESKKELPIVRVENQQYIHYQKGSLVTYALADAVGEDKVNAGLKQIFEKFRFAPAPYPTSRDLMAAWRSVLPVEQHGYLVDWFESITLYSVRCEDARLERTADGKYKVTIDVLAEKTKSDELGKELPVPMTEPVDIGVLGAKGRVLLMERHTIPVGADGNGKATFTLTVDEKPERAGIDPLHKLIDRVPDDNTRPVK